jgi:hypothetical protein
MLYQPVHVLLIAVAAALALPEPGRWDPFRLVRAGARLLAADLPKEGPWAAPAGLLLLVPMAAAAVATAWALTRALPLAIGLTAVGAMHAAALVLAAAALRLTLQMPAVWRWRAPAAPWRPPGGQPSAPTLVGRCDLAAEFAAPVLLFALLGLYAAVIYRAALEIASALDGAQRLGAPAAWAAYLPAAPAHRLVTLFAAVAARKANGQVPTVAAMAGTMALALLVTIW